VYTAAGGGEGTSQPMDIVDNETDPHQSRAELETFVCGWDSKYWNEKNEDAIQLLVKKLPTIYKEFKTNPESQFFFSLGLCVGVLSCINSHPDVAGDLCKKVVDYFSTPKQEKDVNGRLAHIVDGLERKPTHKFDLNAFA